jgi:phospholipase C
VNFVDHTQTDQTSVLKLIEDNWFTGKIGDASFDSRANGLWNMFNFWWPQAGKLPLDPKTGAVVGSGHH